MSGLMSPSHHLFSCHDGPWKRNTSDPIISFLLRWLHKENAWKREKTVEYGETFPWRFLRSGVVVLMGAFPLHSCCPQRPSGVLRAVLPVGHTYLYYYSFPEFQGPHSFFFFFGLIPFLFAYNNALSPSVRVGGPSGSIVNLKLNPHSTKKVAHVPVIAMKTKLFLVWVYHFMSQPTYKYSPATYSFGCTNLSPHIFYKILIFSLPSLPLFINALISSDNYYYFETIFHFL